jgi:integrase
MEYLVILQATLHGSPSHTTRDVIDADTCADAEAKAIAKACRALAIPTFSPHDLRHRRISLLHLRGMPWARIGEWVGQKDLAVTANTYTHLLTDETELDYRSLLARAS